MNLSAPITDVANGLECLGACQQAYDTATITSADCNILISEQPEFLHLSCRGSKSVPDWLSDFDARLITVSGGKAHAGVWLSYQNISSALRTKLRTFARKPLVVDGHSRGGGHAPICAMDLFGEYDIALVTTFGGMRWADESLAAQYDKWLKEKTIRWCNGLDPVPHVPFDDMGYRHVGHEAYLKSTGGMAFDPSEWELSYDSMEEMVKDIKDGKPDIFQYHHLEQYRGRISELTSR